MTPIQSGGTEPVQDFIHVCGCFLANVYIADDQGDPRKAKGSLMTFEVIALLCCHFGTRPQAEKGLHAVRPSDQYSVSAITYLATPGGSGWHTHGK